MSRLAVVLAVVSVLGLPVTASAQKEKELPNRPWPVPKHGTGRAAYWGVVTELGKDSITVKFADDAPVHFPASETLASGGFAKAARPLPGYERPHPLMASSMYRLKDVKVRDWVTIDYVVIDGAVTCDHICINKRPGGRMPPLPKEAEDLRRPPPAARGPRPYIPYHEYWDAYWDLEDKGIPYPEKFGDKRRWPAAPMPRELKRGPAIAQ